MNKELEYLRRLKEILKRHIGEIEKEIQADYAEDGSYALGLKEGRIDSFKFILKNMRIAGVTK